MTRAFFDTNVLVYAYAEADPRADRARALLRDGGRTGVQPLNEFVNVARRKLWWDWVRIDDAIAELHEVFDHIVILDERFTAPASAWQALPFVDLRRGDFGSRDGRRLR